MKTLSKLSLLVALLLVPTRGHAQSSGEVEAEQQEVAGQNDSDSATVQPNAAETSAAAVTSEPDTPAVASTSTLPSYNVALITVKSGWQHVPDVIAQKDAIRKVIYPIATDDEYENPLANIQRMILGDAQHAVSFEPDHFVQVVNYLKSIRLVR